MQRTAAGGFLQTKHANALLLTTHQPPVKRPQGDYHRYLAEFKTGADRKEAAEHTLLAYKAAQVRVYGAGHA